jgi:outer membrane protein assembly factor BamD
MQRIILLVFASIMMISCKSTFEDTLKSKDIEKKKTLAFEYFKDEDYFKASDLFKVLIQDVSGGVEVEEMFYYYAMCDFYLEDYGLAAYEFERLIQKFPGGKFTEQSQFYIGKANYKEAPAFQLDQDYTNRAIESFQLFLDIYPESDKREEVNKLVDELTARLEKKAYYQAKLYYETSDYKSSAVAFNNVLNDFPDTDHHEEINFLIADSKYLLAKKSIESKQIKRYKAAVQSASSFNKKYTESNYSRNVDQIKLESSSEIKRLKLDLPKFYAEKGNFDEAINIYVTLIRHERNEERRNELVLRLFQVHHKKARSVSTEKRLSAYEDLIDFLEEQKQSQLDYLNTSIKAKITSAKIGYEKQKSSSAYALYKEGKYYYSVKAYQKLLKTKELVNKDKHVYFLMLNSYKLSENYESKKKKEILDSIIIRATMYGTEWSDLDKSYSSKVKRLLGKVDKDLLDYPQFLVSGPMSNSNYKKAISRAQTLIKQDITKKDKEEIVYLLILASVKHARKGKRFERLGRYEYAERLYSQYVSIVKDEKMILRISDLKQKIDKRITKYQIKEE